MENYDLSSIETPGFAKDYRRMLARYYGDLPEQARIHVHKMCLGRAQSPEESYRIFLETLHAMKLTESPFRYEDEERARLGTAIRLWRLEEKKRKKPKVKTAFVHLHYHEILELREQGLTWRQLEHCLKKTHSVQIGFSFLRRVFMETAYERR
jgi:hypothetical protein